MYKVTSVDLLLADWKKQGISKANIVRGLAERYLGWKYVYASQGQVCTPEWRKSRIPYCPSEKYVSMINTNCPVLSGKQPTIYCNKPHSNEKMISPESCDRCDFVDTDVFDCAGFVLSLLQRAGVPFYGQGATTQWNTASNWAAQGEISTMPKTLVCAIYKRKEDKMSHAGMSMGDGNGGAIHCSTFVKRGNAYTDNPKWTHWGIPKGLYSTDELRKAGIDVREDDNMPTLRRGSQGDEVADLQTILNARYGADLEVDGNFGKATEAAVKAFQKSRGLTADGVVGPKTWKALGVTGNTNPPADNGSNELSPSEPETQPQTITIPLADWQAIKAAIAVAYNTIKQYEG